MGTAGGYRVCVIHQAEAMNDEAANSFLKTLETYSKTIDKNTTIILTTEGEYFKYLTKTSP